MSASQTKQISLERMAPAQLEVFIEKQAGECMTPAPSEERNWSQNEVCTVCTCGERSNHFIEDMMNLVLLFTYLKSPGLWLRQKRLAPCCACTCGKGPKHFIEDMNFEIRQRCGTCPPSKQQNEVHVPTGNDGEHLSPLTLVCTPLEY